MDWYKAKNIILIMLILLNIFLFINVMNVKDAFKATGRFQKEAKQALEAAGVNIDTSIPSYSRPVGKISYMDDGTDIYGAIVKKIIGGTVDSTIDPLAEKWQDGTKTLSFSGNYFIYTDDAGLLVLSMEDEKKIQRQLLSWIKANGISKDTFIYDNQSQEGPVKIYEFVRKYRKFSLFDNKIRFYIQGEKLVKVEGSLKILYTIKPSKADEIVSANIVLLTGKDKVDGVVKAIELGYMQFEGEDIYDIPVWRVLLDSGKKVFYNAYTGEWIDLQ